MADKIENVDLLIVGAGPAGSTAAVSALRENPLLKVVLVDKTSFPRDKPCGDGIGPGVVHVLEELDMLSVLDDEEPITSISVYGPRGVSFQGELPLINGKRVMGYVIPRVSFDNRILNCAIREGVDFRPNWRFTELLVQGKEAPILNFDTPDGVKVLRASAVIAADGASSRIRSALGVKRNSDRTTGIAIRSYSIPNPRPDRSLVLEWSENLLPAYAWLFPCTGEVSNVGTGLIVRDRKRRKFEMEDALKAFRDVLDGRGTKLTELEGQRTYLLPYGSQLPKLSHGRIVLIGDAGSMINPLSGEGIFYGMVAAQSVGSLVANSNENEITFAMKKFEVDFRRRFKWHYRSNYLASVFMRSITWTSIAIRAASKSDQVVSESVNMMFGDGKLTASTALKILWYGFPR